MLLPKPSEGGSFETPPAGTFVAICYRFVDCGTQKTEFNGQTKYKRQIMLTWELSDEKMADGRPFSTSKKYTLSMHEKSGLRKDLESWRGLAFRDEDFEGPKAFNTKKLVGAPCLLTLTHTVKGDTTYANVTGIGKLVKGMPIPTMINAPIYLVLAKDEFEASALEGLSDKMKSLITSSPEYREIVGRSTSHHDDPDNYPDEDSRTGFDPDDSIPF